MDSDELALVVKHQLKNMFMVMPEGEEIVFLDEAIEWASKKTMKAMRSFFRIETGKHDTAQPSPFSSVQYANFLYWLSRYSYEQGQRNLADRIYYLNKSLNCVELYYEVQLPDVWFCEHPLGSVMGKARYGDYFFFYQGCTVGGNFRKDGAIVYPQIGSHVKMMSNSKILGGSVIGNNVILSANSYVKDSEVPDDTIVFGQSPNLCLKDNMFKMDSGVDCVLTK